MTDNLTLGGKVALFRKKAGFTQQEIAGKLGVSRSLVGQIEKDLTKPNLDFLAGFIALVNIRYDDLLGAKELVDELNKATKSAENRTVQNEKLTPPGLGFDALFRNLQKALSTIYEVYFILLDPIYEKLPSKSDKKKVQETLTVEFKRLEIVKSHIYKDVLSDETIEYVIEAFLKSKETDRH